MSPYLNRAPWRLTVRHRPGLYAAMLTAALCTAGLLAAQHRMDVDRQQLQWRVEMLARRRVALERVPQAAAQVLPEATLRMVRGQLRLLNRDWSALSSALLPGDTTVRLLVLDVDPSKGAVTLTGRAPDAATANRYARLLSGRTGVLRDVRLLGIARDAGSVQFEVDARWSE